MQTNKTDWAVTAVVIVLIVVCALAIASVG
jgi:hypothetical protein